MPNWAGTFPGDLRERVVIKLRTRTQDTSTGEEVTDWDTTYTTVWADAEFMSAGEAPAAQKISAQATLRLTVRYRTDLNETMRVSWRGALWNIHGFVADSEKFFMQLVCSKVE